MTVPTSNTCCACGSSELESHFRVAGAAGPEGLIPTTNEFGSALSDIVRCRTCGHLQLERMPSRQELVEAYREAASDDYIGEEAGQRETARRVLERLERQVEPGRLVDVGCWVGFLLAEARDRGWDGVGIEPSGFAAGYAHEALGLDVRRSELFEADLPAASFDAAWMGDVIEHLVDPASGLDAVAGWLKPGGVLGLALPDAGSAAARVLGRRWWSVIPTHVQYFTRRSIRTLLERRGWTVLDIRTAPKAFTLGYYLGRIGGYRPRLGRALAGTAERARIGSHLVAPDLRDRILIIARAPGARDV